MAVIGSALGLAGAPAAQRLTSGLLFGVSPIDPLTFAGATAVLLGIAAVATLVPGVRATRIDPARALHQDQDRGAPSSTERSWRSMAGRPSFQALPHPTSRSGHVLVYYVFDALQLEDVARSLRDVAPALGVGRSDLHRWRLSRKPLDTARETATDSSEIPSVGA